MSGFSFFLDYWCDTGRSSEMWIFIGRIRENGHAVPEEIFYREDEEMMTIYEELRGRRRVDKTGIQM